MAKINIELDTEALTMTCSVDGEKLDYVRDINIYHYPETSYSKEKYEFSARTHELKSGNVQKCMYVYASKEQPKKEVLTASEDVKRSIAQKLGELLSKQGA